VQASKQASRKNVALAYIMIKFGNLWSKPISISDAELYKPEQFRALRNMPKKHTAGNFIKVENLINVCVYLIAIQFNVLFSFQRRGLKAQSACLRFLYEVK